MSERTSPDSAELILTAWRKRFPTNMYAWPGAPESFAAEAAKALSLAQPSAERAACEEIANEEFERQIKIIADATDDKALSDTGRAGIHTVADACALTAQRIASRIRGLAVTSTDRSQQQPSCARAGGNCECTSIDECARAFAQANQE